MVAILLFSVAVAVTVEQPRPAVPPSVTNSPLLNSPSASASAKQPGQMKVLRFPPGRSLGQTYLQEPSSEKPPDSLHFWTDDAPWDYLCEAIGDVAIPAHKRVWLAINNQTVWQDLSPLLELKADDLYRLSIRGSDQPGATAGTPPMTGTKYIAHLTGLRILDLPYTNISDMTFVKGMTSLEYLTPPNTITDAGLAVVAQLPNLKGLYFNKNRVTNEGLAALARMTALEELSLTADRCNDAGLVHLAGLPRLRYLLLQGQGFTNAGIAHLKNVPSLWILNLGFLPQLGDAALLHVAQIPGLEAVSFYWCENITDQGVAQMTKMPSLKQLDITHSKVTDKGLAHISQIKTLQSLGLPNKGITDVGLQHVSTLPNLKKLSVSRAHYVDPKMNKEYYTNQGLAAISKCTHLEDLSIGSIGVTDAGMDHIARLTNLKALLLFGCDNLTDAGLAKLTTLKSLTNLDITDANVTMAGVNRLMAISGLTRLDVSQFKRNGSVLNIAGLRNLEDLTLSFGPESDDKFTDADLACLSQLKKLRWLQIGPRDFTNAGLAYLVGLTNMERLGIGGQGLTDEGLKFLTGMKQLNHLSIRDGNITDKGLDYLGSIKTLTFLNITTDGDFSPAAVRRLRTNLPNLAILNINKGNARR